MTNKILQNIALTEKVRSSGWAAKLDPGFLDKAVSDLKAEKDERLLVGIEHSDDAGVFQLNEDTALIQTLDFLTPVTDSPYEFGQIAAANSLSDVYAMGGKPVTAMNIVCFPSCDMPAEVLKETLAGGLDKIQESGAVLVGGHSVDDQEFKYGLSVTGVVHPKKILKNSDIKTGDRLILTKPVGTGIIATAVKGKLADEKAIRKLVDVSSTLNKKAAEVMVKYNPSACTDITGFGLAGHLLEMARGGGKAITLTSVSVPIIEEAIEFASMGLIPEGSYKNKSFFEKSIEASGVMETHMMDFMFDPQTSGGLLIAIGEKNSARCVDEMRSEGIDAQIIGEVTGCHPEGFLTII